jgi:hypothetical protein
MYCLGKVFFSLSDIISEMNSGFHFDTSHKIT